MIDEKRFTNVLDFWYRALQVERFGKDDLEDLYRTPLAFSVLQTDRVLVRWQKEAYLLDVDTMACAAENETCTHRFGKPSGLSGVNSSELLVHFGQFCSYLIGYLFLIFSWKVNKVVVLRTNEEGYSSLVEASSLSVPFLDRIQCTLPSKIEHEKYCDGIIANKWEHVHEFPLASKVPNRECDFCVPYRDRLLHKIYAYC